MHLKEIQKNNHINQSGIIVTVVYQKNVGCVGRQVQFKTCRHAS